MNPSFNHNLFYFILFTPGNYVSQIYTIWTKVLVDPLLMKGLTTLVISMSMNLNVSVR